MGSRISWSKLRNLGESNVMNLIRELGVVPLEAIQKLDLEDVAEQMVNRGVIQKVGDAYLAMQSDDPNHHVHLAVHRAMNRPAHLREESEKK